MAEKKNTELRWQLKGKAVLGKHFYLFFFGFRLFVLFVDFGLSFVDKGAMLRHI